MGLRCMIRPDFANIQSPVFPRSFVTQHTRATGVRSSMHPRPRILKIVTPACYSYTALLFSAPNVSETARRDKRPTGRGKHSSVPKRALRVVRNRGFNRLPAHHRELDGGVMEVISLPGVGAVALAQHNSTIYRMSIDDQL